VLAFVLRRILYLIPLIFVISFIAFIIIDLQPGNYVENQRLNPTISPELLDKLTKQFGLDQPWYVRYYKWITNVVLHGDFGWSFEQKRPALSALISDDRWIQTIALLLVTLLFSWLIAVPIGIYSATHKYSSADYSFTFLGFLGLSIPNFILALIFLELAVGVFHISQVQVNIDCMKNLGIGGFYSNPCRYAPWSLGKALDFLWHFWPAIVIIGTSQMAAIIRYMRGNLLDVLDAEYIQTARAKGLAERIVIYKHAVRNAINPLISMLGYWIPFMFEGVLVTVVVLNLPTIEYSYYLALLNQDEPVIMGGLLLISVMLLLGNLISDILLALADPRIRYD